MVDVREAVRDGAPQVWPEAPGNIAVDWPGLAADPDGNAKEVERVIASAAHVARVSLVHQRIMVHSMEPRGATASYDPAADSYLLRCCSQSARALRDGLAPIMGVPKERLRVTTEDVGGAFGLKTGPYPEYLAILVAARKLGRPVHWMSNRAEAFLSDNHARDAYSEVELALDEKGKFLALRVRHLGNMGAYIGAVGANIQTVNLTRCLPGMYDIQLIDMGARCVFTNTTPTAPYRGAGRPEANFILERAIDEAARVTGIDPVKLRRRNLIKPKAMPYKTAVGTTIDSGEFETILDKALALADYDGFKQRRREAGKRGKYRGLGISCMLEHAGGFPLEGTLVSFPGGETVVLSLNVQSTGQGHATTFNPMLAERLGIRPEQIQHRQGDSAMEIAGYASVGSRSAMTVSHAMIKTVEALLAKGKTIAAAVLEAADADIEYRDGRFNVVGTDRAISLFDLAARAKEMKTARRDPRGSRHQGQRRDAAHLSQRLPHRRGGDRSRDRRAGARLLRGGRRLRQRAQPDDRRGPGARLDRPGARPGDDGERGVRRLGRAARHRLVHGLRHAARRRPAAVQGRHAPGAGEHQPARRQGRRRGRHHRGDRRADERDRRRHPWRRRRASRHAGDAGEAMAGVPQGGAGIALRFVDAALSALPSAQIGPSMRGDNASRSSRP